MKHYLLSIFVLSIFLAIPATTWGFSKENPEMNPHPDPGWNLENAKSSNSIVRPASRATIIHQERFLEKNMMEKMFFTRPAIGTFQKIFSNMNLEQTASSPANFLGPQTAPAPRPCTMCILPEPQSYIGSMTAIGPGIYYRNSEKNLDNSGNAAAAKTNRQKTWVTLSKSHRGVNQEKVCNGGKHRATG